jgi:pilus assembly protein Flp/PilA
MRPFLRSVVAFLKSEDGPTTVEYAVNLALIVTLCISAIRGLGSNANQTFTAVGTALKSTGS